MASPQPGETGPGKLLMAADCLAMPGAHNRQNMLLAAAAGLEAGLSGAQMEQAFRSFTGVPHRLERIREQQGISFYNDSKATNYDAAEVALHALDGPLVVLAGGESKQEIPIAGWQPCNRKPQRWCFYGAAQAEFDQLLSQAGFSGVVHCCDSLAEAVPWPTN